MSQYSESELAFLSISQAARLLRRKEISPVDLVDAALGRIERYNSSLNAFLTILAESARRQAKAAEREIVRGRSRGLLHGIPISLKDNFCTRGVRTTAGSRILADFVPKADSDVARRLAHAGAILLGKTNMHEFAYGITGENPHFGDSRNPWALERISGGSSGGSAAAVAAGMGFASVGTDTGGSIRIPSALSGLVGLKPTFSAVSTEGVIPLAVSFDHAGPMARRVMDVCIMFEAIAEEYPRDATRPGHRKLQRSTVRGLRIGWPKQYFFERLDPEVSRLVKAAANTFESLGARIRDIALPRLGNAMNSAVNLPMAEASYYHESQGYFPGRAEEYGPDVRGHLERGHGLLAVDYFRALDRKHEIERDFDEAFEQVDVILAPTSPIPASVIGERSIRIAGKDETAVRAELLRLTRPANLTGIPAVSVPCGFTRQGLPVGMQLIGPKRKEARLLAAALAYEEATDWHEKRPDLRERLQLPVSP